MLAGPCALITSARSCSWVSGLPSTATIRSPPTAMSLLALEGDLVGARRCRPAVVAGLPSTHALDERAGVDWEAEPLRELRVER